MVQSSRKITEKRLKWYGHVSRMKEEHIVRRMFGHTGERKKRTAKPTKERCMQERHDKSGSERGQHDKQSLHGGIRSSAIPATPDERTSQGKKCRVRMSEAKIHRVCPLNACIVC